MSLAARDAPLRWDYSFTDVEQLTRGALLHQIRRVGMDHEDCHDAAYHGVVKLLYTAEERPTRSDLFWAGVQEIQTELRLTRQAWGQRTVAGNIYLERGSTPQFARYWAQRHTTFPDDAICERLALPQVLSQLSARQYELLIAVAAHATQEQAAEALGLAPATVRARLCEIRTLIRHRQVSTE